MEEQKNQVSSIEYLYYLSGILKNGVDGRFLATEFASAIMKRELRKAGFEITKKQEEV